MHTCSQVIQRRSRVAEGVEHATEISTTPGNAMRRRSRREWQHVAHGNSKPVLGSFARGRQARRVDPMRHMLPFSPRSSPPSDPGRSDYLRGVICALRQLATPLDDLGSGMRSRRDLACIFIKSRTLRLRLDCRFGTRAPSGAGEWLSAQIMPRRYQGRPGSIGGDDLGENGGPAMTPKSRGY